MTIQGTLILYTIEDKIGLYCPEIHYFLIGNDINEVKYSFFAAYPLDLDYMKKENILLTYLTEKAGWNFDTSIIPPQFSEHDAIRRLTAFLEKEAHIVATVKHPIALPIYEEDNHSNNRST